MNPENVGQRLRFCPTYEAAAENVDKGDIVCLWDLTNPRAQPSPLPGPAPITALAFSLDGHKVAAADKNRQVLLWNLDDPTATPSILSGYEHPARCSPSARMAIPWPLAMKAAKCSCGI